MKKKRFLLTSFLLLGAGVTLGLAACNRPAVTPEREPREISHQENMFNTLLDTRNLDASLDVNIKYRDYEFQIGGTAYVTLDTIEDIKADMTLTLDMPKEKSFKEQEVKATYLNSTFFLSISDRNLKLHTDNVNDILELFTSEATEEEAEETSSPMTLKTTHLADLLKNIEKMDAKVNGNEIQYTIKTWDDYPEVHMTSDLNYKITSMSMENVVAGDFTFSFDFRTNVLDIDDDRVTSPETAEKPYIDVSNYLGAFRDIKKIVNDKHVALAYTLDCTRYGDPVASTEGRLSFDIDNFIVQLAGDVTIGDYVAPYDARYIGDDEAVYLNFDDTFKLSYTNQGLGDLWKILDDKEVFPVSIFDLIWGASGKVYPILDIIGDGTYLDLLDYFDGVTLTDHSVSMTIDNTVWGGSDDFDLTINFDDDHITNIIFDNLDINDYKVNVEFTLTEYKEITPLDKENYSSLDGLDKVLKHAMPMVNNKQVALGLDIDVKSPEEKTIAVNGTAQLDLNNFSVQSIINVKDFGDNDHNLILSTYREANTTNDYLCVGYTYRDSSTNTSLRAKTSYDSIMSVVKAVTGIMSRTSGEETPEVEAAVPVVVDATATTISKVLDGDYLAILKDKAIKEFSIADGKYTIVLDKTAIGLD